MESSEYVICLTILYADIFDFPLTEAEIWKYLITEEKQYFPRSQLKQKLSKLVIAKKISQQGVFYSMPDRLHLFQKRIDRKKNAEEKLFLASHIASWLAYIPTLSFLGISGSLAMENTDPDDDIDFFIITKKNALWVTRFSVLLILQLLGVRRRRGHAQRNKICVNMIIDETAMPFAKDRQDLYTAHEIVQILPIINKHGTYEQFLKKNLWMTRYLPNAYTAVQQKNSITKQTMQFFLVPVFEYLVKIAQRWYMKSHRTTEEITDHFVAFHPYDHKQHTAIRLKKLIKHYGLSQSQHS